MEQAEGYEVFASLAAFCLYNRSDDMNGTTGSCADGGQQEGIGGEIQEQREGEEIDLMTLMNHIVDSLLLVTSAPSPTTAAASFSSSSLSFAPRSEVSLSFYILFEVLTTPVDLQSESAAADNGSRRFRELYEKDFPPLSAAVRRTCIDHREILMGLLGYSGVAYTPLVCELIFRSLWAMKAKEKERKEKQQPGSPHPVVVGSLPRYVKWYASVLSWIVQSLSNFQQQDGSLQFVEEDIPADENDEGSEVEGATGGAGTRTVQTPYWTASTWYRTAFGIGTAQAVSASPTVAGVGFEEEQEQQQPLRTTSSAFPERSLLALLRWIQQDITSLWQELQQEAKRTVVAAAAVDDANPSLSGAEEDVQRLFLLVASTGTAVLAGLSTAMQFEGAQTRQMLELRREERMRSAGRSGVGKVPTAARRGGEKPFAYSVPLFRLPATGVGGSGCGADSASSCVGNLSGVVSVVEEALSSGLEVDFSVHQTGGERSRSGSGSGSGTSKQVAVPKNCPLNVLLFLLSRAKAEDAMQRILTLSSRGLSEEVDELSAVYGEFLTNAQRTERKMMEIQRLETIRKEELLWSDGDDDDGDTSLQNLLGEEEGFIEDDDESYFDVDGKIKDSQLRSIMEKEFVPFHPIGVATYAFMQLALPHGQDRRDSAAAKGVGDLPANPVDIPWLAQKCWQSKSELLLQLLPFVSAALKHDALRAKEQGLLLLLTFTTNTGYSGPSPGSSQGTALLPERCVDISTERKEYLQLGGGNINDDVDGGKGDDDDEDTKQRDSSRFSSVCVTKEYQTYFVFAQDLVNLMATCPSVEHRELANEALRKFLSIFVERIRMQLLKGLVELVPYPSVKSLLLLILKEWIQAEYGFLDHHLKKAPLPPPPPASTLGGVGSSGGWGDKRLTHLRSWDSQTLTADTLQFLTKAVRTWTESHEQVRANGEPVITTLNVLRTWLALDLKLARAVVVDVEGHADAGGTTGSLCCGHCFSFFAGSIGTDSPRSWRLCKPEDIQQKAAKVFLSMSNATNKRVYVRNTKSIVALISNVLSPRQQLYKSLHPEEFIDEGSAQAGTAAGRTSTLTVAPDSLTPITIFSLEMAAEGVWTNFSPQQE